MLPLVHIGAWIMSNILYAIKLTAAAGETISLQSAIYKNVFLSFVSPVNASLLYAISFISVWLFLMWLLYRKRIYIKV